MLSNKETKQFIKYWISGGVYFWIGYLVFIVFYSFFKWNWFYAKIIADVVGWLSNYLLQRHWAFKDQIHLSEMEHSIRYIMVEGVGFILDYLIIFGLKSIDITPYIGFFISSAFFTVWSWFWYKHFVFPKKRKVI